jgi:hypothetical protein
MRATLVFFLLVPFIHSQEIDPAEMGKISIEVEKEVQKRVKGIVTPLILAEKEGIPFPPVAPTRTVEDIKKEVNAKVQAAVDEKYPASIKEKQLALARKRYPLHKIGDVVNIKLKAGGRKKNAQGEYKGLNRQGQLLIGGYEFAKVDMTEDVMVHFDPKLNKVKIDKLVSNKLFYFYEDREKMKANSIPIVEKELFSAAGYFIKGEEFLAADVYLEKLYTEEKEKVSVGLLPVVEQELFGKYGYSQEDGIWKKADSLVEPKDTVASEEFIEKPKEPLFDPNFYDPDF